MNKPIYRMSEVGMCPRVLGAIRLGYDPLPETEATLRVFREGRRQEDWVIEDLRDEGYGIIDRQRELIFETPILILQGHIDGIVTSMNMKAHLLEIKSLGRFTFQKYQSKGLDAFPEYQAQVTCYDNTLSWAEDHTYPILFVVKCRDTGEVIKTELSEPPLSFDDITDKLNMVELCVQDEALPDAEFSDSDQCRWCRFKYLCSKPEPEEKAKLENLPNLVEAATLYKESREYQRLTDERKEQATHTFLQHSKSNQVDKFRVSGVSFSYSGEKQREWLDEKVIRAEAPPELIEKALRKSRPYDSFTIRVLKEEK